MGKFTFLKTSVTPSTRNRVSAVAVDRLTSNGAAIETGTDSCGLARTIAHQTVG